MIGGVAFDSYELTCPPLAGTARSPERPTLGPRVAEIHQALLPAGKTPMPHQRLIYDVAFELDPDTGYLAYDKVVVIGPRQATGKTAALKPVMTHRCLGFDAVLAEWCLRELGRVVDVPGPQRVVYTAQTADDAAVKWRRDHVAALERSRYSHDFVATLQRNWEVMTWKNGSTWSPASTTAKTAGTGDVVDLGVIDEAWSRPDGRTELGLRPAQMTRPWSQLWVLSMIPGLSRAQPGTWPYLKSKLDVGLAQTAAGVRSGTAFFFFAAPPGSDPMDPATWRAAMPGLGITVPERRIRSDFEEASLAGGIALVDLSAEYLGWVPDISQTPRWTLIPWEVWSARVDPSSRIVGDRAFALEMNESRTRGWIGVAGYRDDGQWHVEVVEPGGLIPPGTPGVDWMQRRAEDLDARWDPCAWVVDSRRQAASLIVPLRNAGLNVYTPAQPETAAACGRFMDATGANPECVPDRWLWHLGQRELDDALASARKYEWAGQLFTFVSKSSGGEVCPLYLAVLGMLGMEVHGAPPGDTDADGSVPEVRRCSGGCGRFVFADAGVWRHADDESAECGS